MAQAARSRSPLLPGRQRRCRWRFASAYLGFWISAFGLQPTASAFFVFPNPSPNQNSTHQFAPDLPYRSGPHGDDHVAVAGIALQVLDDLLKSRQMGGALAILADQIDQLFRAGGRAVGVGV